jgi:hypothetical protein
MRQRGTVTKETLLKGKPTLLNQKITHIIRKPSYPIPQNPPLFHTIIVCIVKVNQLTVPSVKKGHGVLILGHFCEADMNVGVSLILEKVEEV